jgi:hypothetical protein
LLNHKYETFLPVLKELLALGNVSENEVLLIPVKDGKCYFETIDGELGEGISTMLKESSERLNAMQATKLIENRSLPEYFGNIEL